MAVLNSQLSRIEKYLEDSESKRSPNLDDITSDLLGLKAR